mmetsp:Transcript_40425/g.114339  ORF Transcript_40425/g.114339 Transcript_40425/m.114339 type:complete len:173 (-) Transcript_40425:184-702(-)
MEKTHKFGNLTWTTRKQVYNARAPDASLGATIPAGAGDCRHGKGFTESFGRDVCMLCGATREEAGLNSTMGAGPVPVRGVPRRRDGLTLSAEVVRALGGAKWLCDRSPPPTPGPGSYKMASNLEAAERGAPSKTAFGRSVAETRRRSVSTPATPASPPSRPTSAPPGRPRRR